MRAWRVHETGSLNNLRFEEVDKPACPPKGLLVRIKACGINFMDKLSIEGRYQEKPPLPFTPGGEIAGVIKEVGSEVTGFAVGDPVMALASFAGLADYAAISPAMAVKLPPGTDPAEAAAFAIAYGTSHVGLDHAARLRPGETLLVTGAGGGVGLTAVEIGKLLGARVIAAASTADKLAAAQAKGADHLIDYSTQDLREAVKAVTGGKGADVVYDPVGGDVFRSAFRSVAFEGRIIVIGFASGDIPHIPANHLLVKNVRVIGLYWGAYSLRKPDVIQQSMTTLLDWYRQGRLAPHISARFALEDADKAIAMVAERRSTGKVVVEMTASSS